LPRCSERRSLVRAFVGIEELRELVERAVDELDAL
jgi:hypothetical protein